MIVPTTWDDFVRFVNTKSWAWNRLLGQDDERKLLGFLGTEVATTSGTSIDFTGIPSWVTEITIGFNGVSTNGSSQLQVQIGTSAGVETTGYNSAAGYGTGAGTFASSTASFILEPTGAGGSTALRYGSMTLRAIDSTTWVEDGSTYSTVSQTSSDCSGAKTAAGTLDRVRITTVNGTDAFDGGAINIRMT